MSSVREGLKKRFPDGTKLVGDVFRYAFRRRQEFGPELRYRRALALAQLGPGQRVLEVGHCGYQTIALARRVQHVTVCNISGVNRAIARLGPRNLEQVQADVCTYPFEPSSFDVALVIAVFEHIPDDGAAARNLCRALRPGGQLIVYVPDTDEHVAAWKRGEYPDHVRPGYTRDGLVDLLSGAGFDVVHCELGNGIYAAVAGDLYYWLAGRGSLFYSMPHVVVRPFMALSDFDNTRNGSLRWGLFCKAVKRQEPVC